MKATARAVRLLLMVAAGFGAGGFGAAGVARADGQPGAEGASGAGAACVTPAEVRASVAAQAPDATVLLVGGAGAARLTAEIEALTGADLPEGGAFMVFDIPGSALAYVVLLVDGCAVEHGKLPAALVKGWVGGSPA